MIKIVDAVSQADLTAVRELFLEYARSLNVSLCFENLDKEIAELPGAYAPPGGRLLLAADGASIAGCVALKKVDDRVCEMKRLYVRADFRGQGLGRTLTKSAADAARGIGYRHLRLDTLPSMIEAIALYRSLGFEEIPPYRELPVAGAHFMRVAL